MWIDGTNNLQDLWKSRCCLNKIEGFDHSVVNPTLGACGHLPELEEGPCLPFSVWQCGEFDVIQLAGSLSGKEKKIPFIYLITVVH